jgi:hypothetical protein
MATKDPAETKDVKETRVEQHEKSNEELRDWTPGDPVPRDPKTRRPLKTGDTLTDEHQPYGVPKDPKTLEPLPVPEPKEGEEVIEEPPPLEAPDTATLTGKEQNHWEVLTGERLQKDPEAEEAAFKAGEDRRKKQAEDRRKAAERRKGLKPGKPDQGLPGGRPAKPDNTLPGTAEPKR